MVRLIAGFIGWFGLGVIIAEALNNYNLFTFRLNAMAVAGSLAFTYVSFQMVLKGFAKRADTSAGDDKTYRKIRTIYQVVLAIIGLGGLISIPFLWWGVIKRLAMSANEGSRLF